MHGTVYPAAELPAHHLERWSRLQISNPMFASPCFRPEFMRAIGTFNRDVFVAVVQDVGEAAGFLAFQRNWNTSIARPVLTGDYQGVVTEPGRVLDIRAVLRACDLNAWHFKHLMAPKQTVLQANRHAWLASLRALCQPDFDAYVKEMSQAGKSMRHMQKQVRYLERDCGPVRFTVDSSEAGVLARILSWKAGRYYGGVEPPAWMLPALEAMHRLREPHFSGVLSTLHAGDDLVAAHFGPRSGRNLHYWFPTFNPRFARYSPGTLLLWLLLQNMAAMGCDTLDFGPGEEPYKIYFSNDSIPTASGCYERLSLSTVADRLARVLRNQAVHGWKYVRPIVRPFRHSQVERDDGHKTG